MSKTEEDMHGITVKDKIGYTMGDMGGLLTFGLRYDVHRCKCSLRLARLVNNRASDTLKTSISEALFCNLQYIILPSVFCRRRRKAQYPG